MYIKRTLSAMMAVTIVVGMSSACSSKTNPNASNTTKKGDATAASQANPAQIKAYDPPVKLSLLVRGNATDQLSDKRGTLGFVEIQNRVGVQITNEVFEGNSDDQYKLMLASGNYPDIIRWTHSMSYPGGIPKLVADGVAIPLNDLVEKEMPHFKNIMEKRDDIRKETTTLDNQYYFFPNINPLETDVDRSVASTTGFAMRKDWLENVGLNAPTTMDEWYQVLTAFKNTDPNGDGKNNDIPFEGTGLDMFTPAFGILNSYYVDPKTKKVKFGPIQPEYKTYLETLNKWYKEGLITSNSLVTNSKLTDSNISADLAGSFKGLNNAWEKYLPALQKVNPKADFVPVAWPKTKDGISYTPRTELNNHINKETTIITSSCKDPVAAARLIDYMYSDEGGFLLSWGIEGKSYQVVNGKKEFIQYPEGAEITAATYAKPHVAWPKYGYEDAYAANFNPIRLFASDAWAKGVNTDLVYPPFIVFSKEESTKIAEINSDIGTYITDMTNKFIEGSEPISNFDTFVENVKKFNVDEIIKIYQTNLDAFNSKK